MNDKILGVFVCLSVCLHQSKNQAGELLLGLSALGSIEIIASVPCACHGTFDINGIWIDLQLPAESLSLRRCIGVVVARGYSSLLAVVALVVGVGVVTRIMGGTAVVASKPADGENVSLQRNLQVLLVNIRHGDGHQKTRLVFVDCYVAVVTTGNAIRIIGLAAAGSCHGTTCSSVISFGRRTIV